MRIAVIGTGTMGKQLTLLFSLSERVSEIFWKGTSGQRAREALIELSDEIDKRLLKKKIDTKTAVESINKIKVIEKYQDIDPVDFILEVVSEDASRKIEVFQEIGRISKSTTIVASSTSSLSITELASFTKYPDKVVGMHFFNPVSVMKLSEIIYGFYTSQETINWAMDFAGYFGKVPVLVKEAPGFIVNRMLIPMINEAIAILAEGIATAEQIDLAMKLGANHPIGPLALADLIGNDIVLSIMETLHMETGDPKYRAHPLLRKMVRANALGRKTKTGFFNY